ncbi:NERD domain-containing protein [Streptomyces odontomachi]|uniref:NERD domain-containing protein n=1 Tax=Streptomyces odontomachi TaxID=2944940 RepID=UPI00210D5D3E|nr:NERD domain-containing protein [Streptomyces sp. ODS25]
MSELRVVPSWRHGRARLYVSLPDGGNVAWFDRDASRVNILRQDLTETVLEALAPYLAGDVTVGPPPVPTPAELARLALHPDDDLAPNRPGEALRVSLEREPAAVRRLRPDPRRRALAAEETVGEALDRMEAAGWRTLHSLLLPGADRIHHLLIGPGGLFALHALHAHRRRVRITPPVVDLGRGTHAPPLSRLRADADRAAHALDVEVRPVLVLVDPAAVEFRTPARDVHVIRDTELPMLGREGVVLKPAEVETLYGTARDRHTWLRL